MKKKIIIPLVLCSLLVSCAPATGGSESDSTGGSDTTPATEIVIYAGGSAEYSWRKGALEEEVYRAVEDAYYQDTGKKLKFNPQFFTQNMKNTITNNVTTGEIDIVISHTGGGDGIDDWIMQNGLYRDLYYDYEDYEYLNSNMVWENEDQTLELNAKARLLTSNDEIIGIPSVINPYKYGILVRKDWMNACGYTDVYDASHPEWKIVDNYVTFEEMCLAMKTKYNLPYTISGAIYEIEKTGILGAFDVPAGYYTKSVGIYNGQNILDVGGLIDPNYSDVLNTESRWIKNGILPKSPDDKHIDDCEADFIAQKTGVFLENPTVEHLIEVARLCKNQNPEAEFTVLQAMTKDSSSTSKGFMRNSVATFGAVITKNTKDYKDILSFINWAYSSQENYDLCRYGVLNHHYFLDENGNYYYPEGYSVENKPYSGILTLVENQLISNRQYAGYTLEERSWIENANKKENYLINDSVDYLLYLNNKEELNKHFANRKAMYNFTTNVWSGLYDFDQSHEHVGHEDATSCKIYNHVDRMTIVNKYLQDTSKYAMEVYTLYQNLKKAAEDI